MRIAVMLRTLDEKGGIGVYSRNLIETLLELDAVNEYLLLYRDPAQLGRYADRPRVSEHLPGSRGNACGTRSTVPLACRQTRRRRSSCIRSSRSRCLPACRRDGAARRGLVPARRGAVLQPPRPRLYACFHAALSAQGRGRHLGLAAHDRRLRRIFRSARGQGSHCLFRARPAFPARDRSDGPGCRAAANTACRNATC